MNERMLEMGVEDSQAWHKQYKDSAYVFIGKYVQQGSNWSQLMLEQFLMEFG